MGYDSPSGGSSTVTKDVIPLLPEELIFAVLFAVLFLQNKKQV